MQWVKLLHVSCVVLSFTGFMLRGLWMLSGSPMLNKKWVKVVPHIVDTVLLSSALFLVYLLGLSIVENNWLLVKIAALIVYILLGSVALKRGKTKKIRILAFTFAVITFYYMISVALTKSTTGFMVLF